MQVLPQSLSLSLHWHLLTLLTDLPSKAMYSIVDSSCLIRFYSPTSNLLQKWGHFSVGAFLIYQTFTFPRTIILRPFIHPHDSHPSLHTYNTDICTQPQKETLIPHPSSLIL